jgi:hypothetical protein
VAFPGEGHAIPAGRVPGGREHIVYFEGTAQELEVYKIHGRNDGPTIMILGGIQGDEPGGFLSADLYVDTALKKGNLIIVPRANFKSIINFDRGSDGDMNRKFGDDVSKSDPDCDRVGILKNLMAESDVFLNLHDGSGFFRNDWESDMANPDRYGQCLIADAEAYTTPAGAVLRLGQVARKAVDIINRDIPEEGYKFRFANHDTLSPTTRHGEQRRSATFYALTKLGIPAFGIETSKQLPSLEMKVHQHNLAVNAFMELYGVELEQPRINLEPPELHFLVVAVNGGTRVAVNDAQRLYVNPGDTIEVLYVGSNYTRGISVDVLGAGGLNDLKVPLRVKSPTGIILRKDNAVFGKVEIAFRPDGGKDPDTPLVADLNGGIPVGAGAGLLPGGPEAPGKPLAPVTQALASAAPRTSGVIGPGESGAPEGRPGFELMVDGRRVRLWEGETLPLRKGAKVTMVGFLAGEGLPKGTVLNLRGFVGRAGDTTGNDLGTTCDTARDLIPRFAVKEGGKTLYQVGAENGKELLFKAFIEIDQPVLESVTFVLDGKERVLPLAGRWKVLPGTNVVLKSVSLMGGRPLSNPRITLGGRPVDPELPTVLTMPGIAVSLAVFSGDELAGKVVLFP